MMPTYQRTSDELIKALDVVCEPMRQLPAMFIWHWCEKEFEFSDREKSALKIACMESSLLNLRKLDDFFRMTNRQLTPEEKGIGLCKPKKDDLFA